MHEVGQDTHNKLCQAPARSGGLVLLLLFHHIQGEEARTHSPAMAVQRGNAMTFLEGYDRALHMALAQHAASARQRVAAEEDEDDRDIATTEDESEGEEESSSEEQRDQEDAA